MVTFKQLEAVFWVVQLGNFAKAAKKLHTTQSAISKRIMEVEHIFRTPLFDRSLRAARPTEKGDEMYLLAKRLLEQRDASVEQFQRPEVLERHIRIGVTELTAMTWLPRLIDAINLSYPRVVIEPHVEASATLRDKLLAEEIDLAIMPDVFNDHRFLAQAVGEAEHAWMCKPGLVGRRLRLNANELADYRLLTQDNRSGIGLLYDHWLRSNGVKVENVLASSSVVALISLAVSGMGISYLPRQCLMPMVESKMLQVLAVTPALPTTMYAAITRSDRPSKIVSDIVALAQSECDFGKTFQTGF